jgi:tetratricopeptide (TPR) repeat protein
LPQTVDVQKQVIDARVGLGLYLAQMIYNADAKAAIDPIIDLAKKHNDKRRLCQIYTILGVYYCFVEDNYIEAFKALEKGLKISEEINDFITSVLASLWFGCLLGWNCEFEKAEQYIQKALDINLAAKNLWGIAVMKSNLACFGCHYLGKMNRGFKITSEAVQAAEESGDPLSKSISYVSHGMSCVGKGLFDEAEKHLLKGLNFSERINLHSWNGIARIYLGETFFETGDFSRSKEHFEKGSLILDHNRLWPSWANFGKIGLARSKVMNKEKDVDLETLYAHCRNSKVKAGEGYIQGYIGEILLNIDDQHLPESEHWIQKAIESDQKNRMMFHLGEDYALYADLFKRKGDRLKAQENLGKAIEILKECGADGWVEKYEEELAALS